ncbi:MAG: ABC transporter permease [Patescibacteria group bacterium]
MFFSPIKSSIKILRKSRNRTFLSILGIVIGIAAVIIIMSVGAGAQSLIFNQITSVGSNLIGVLPGYSDEEGPPASIMGIAVTTLKHEDALALKKITGVEAVTSYVRGIESIQWQNQTTDATYIGTTAEYPQVESADMEIGDFFDASSETGIARVAVLGWQVWQELFGDQSPVGETIRIKSEQFRVIGVIEKKGVQGFENKDMQVFIPLETAQKLMLGIRHVNMIRIKVVSDEMVSTALDQTKAILRERHRLTGTMPDDFTARAATQALDSLGQITNALKFFLAGIAAISLLVGGVGIMNIMLIAVNERMREIGLRKAVGATNSNIQTQFLSEALVLTVVGGVIGIIVGAAVSALVALVANYLGYQWQYVVTLSSIVLGVGFSGMVGIVFGWYPARRASKLEPVEALRYE